MPKSLSSLNSYCGQVEMNYDIVYVREETQSEPFWIRGKAMGDELIIYEFPRTLFSIYSYMKEDVLDSEKQKRTPKKFMPFFMKR